ncbi:MAG: hypothetical protein K0R65_585 [Crocinitomicaceae bacterium]|jgi:hypothetical protein|nr:hypothetical protein [Crocinitomicaceae bacterium]
MQVFHFIKRTLPVFIGILILWFGLFFYAAILNQSNRGTTRLVPKDANFVFQVNIKEFVKSSTYSLIFNSKDQALLNAFEIYLEKQRKGDQNTNRFGVDFTQDLTIFGQNYKGGEVYVMVFNLFNPHDFEENTRPLLTSKQALLRKDNIGIVLTYFGKSKVSQNELNAYLAKLEFTKEDKKQTIAPREFFNLALSDFKVNEKIHVEKGEIRSQVDENRLLVNGEFTTRKKSYEVSRWTLIPNGLHIENSLISNAMQDTMQKYLQQIGISIDQVDRISMNYYGTEIQETERGILFTPIFDLLLTFKEDFSLQKMFKDVHFLEELGFEKENNIIHAGKLDYYIDSVDHNTLFIGNQLKQVVRRRSKNLFSVSGDIANLTSIKGGGFISSFIEMLPPFRASKGLFQNIKTINFQAVPTIDNDKVIVSGDMTFKDNSYLYNEFLRFFLTLKGEM